MTSKGKGSPEMANLYLTEQGSILRKKGDRLIVEKEKQTLLDLECHKIDAVLVFGNVQFTTQAVHKLFQHGIELAILTRTGRLIGQITSPMTKNIELRVEQFKKYGDEVFKLGFSKIIVKGKVRNSLQLLRSFAYNHPEVSLKEEMEGLERAETGIIEQNTLEGLNGVEGMAARYYFNGYAKMMLGEFTFDGRRKYPAPDPVNAILSLGYTMIFNEISSLLDGMGFDPYLGYYHKIDYGRASLASDLLEEFRAPVADRFTLKLVNDRILKPGGFYENPKGEGVYLKREPMKTYFAEYEDFVNHEFTHPETKEKTCYRKCFRIQAEKLATCVKGEREYQPFEMET
jgi:CRISPR-associated protein Cas1